MNVQGRGRGLAGQRAEPLDELLLEVVGQVVLRTKENDAALRDLLGSAWCFVGVDMRLTGDGEVAKPFVGVFAVQQVVDYVDADVLATDDRRCLFELEVV